MQWQDKGLGTEDHKCHIYPPKELGPYLPTGSLKLFSGKKGERGKTVAGQVNVSGLYSLPTAAMPLSVLCQMSARLELQLEIMGASADLAYFPRR